MTQIRPALVSDAPRIQELCTQLGYPHSIQEIQNFIQNYQSLTFETLDVWVDDQGVVQGLLQMRLNHTIYDGAHPEVVTLVVDQALRGQGIGKMLMTYAEQWSKLRGHHKLKLRSGHERTEAHQFYQNLGYDLRRTSHLFQRDF